MSEGGHLSADDIGQVRKEVVNQVARWLIALVALLVVAALLGWWFYFEPILKKIVGGVPTGAVMAFDVRDQCPDGWQVFPDAIGRTLVGAAFSGSAAQNKDETGAVIAPPDFSKAGGVASSVLGVANIPPLAVPVPFQYSMVSDSDGGFPQVRLVGSGPERYTAATGGNAEPFTNLPPYLALTFCRKT